MTVMMIMRKKTVGLLGFWITCSLCRSCSFEPVLASSIRFREADCQGSSPHYERPRIREVREPSIFAIVSTSLSQASHRHIAPKSLFGIGNGVFSVGSSLACFLGADLLSTLHDQTTGAVESQHSSLLLAWFVVFLLTLACDVRVVSFCSQPRAQSTSVAARRRISSNLAFKRLSSQRRGALPAVVSSAWLFCWWSLACTSQWTSKTCPRVQVRRLGSPDLRSCIPAPSNSYLSLLPPPAMLVSDVAVTSPPSEAQSVADDGVGTGATVAAASIVCPGCLHDCGPHKTNFIRHLRTKHQDPAEAAAYLVPACQDLVRCPRDRCWWWCMNANGLRKHRCKGSSEQATAEGTQQQEAQHGASVTPSVAIATLSDPGNVLSSQQSTAAASAGSQSSGSAATAAASSNVPAAAPLSVQDLDRLVNAYSTGL